MSGLLAGVPGWLLSREGALSLLLALGLGLAAGGLAPARPSRAARLAALDVDALEAARGEAPPPAGGSALGRLLRPVQDDLGAAVAAVARRLGIGAASGLERDLVLVRPGRSAASFYGDQAFVGLLGLGFGPLLNALGVTPFGPWPLWVALALGAAGALGPLWELRGRVARRRRAIVAELPHLLDHLRMAIGAGVSPEEALRALAEGAGGVLAGELRRALIDQTARRLSLGAALGAVAARNGIPQLSAALTIFTSAELVGTSLVDGLRAQAAALRDEEQARLVAEGGKAMVRMILPVAICILPVIFVILFLPAWAQLLSLRGP